MSGPEAITACENALYTAMLAFDYPALNAILSDDLRYIHSTGVMETKPEYFAGLQRGLYEYGAITTLSGQTRPYRDIAVTSSVIDMVVGANGSAKGTIRLQTVLIWGCEDGAWRLLLRQATRIPG